MRLWSLSPSLLDQKGLVALWREALLAKAVLEGKTKGYKNHSQLIRFKLSNDPIAAINFYLKEVYLEATRCGYSFDSTKFVETEAIQMEVTQGQLEYEFKHLLRKLEVRCPAKFNEIEDKDLKAHSLFKVIPGYIADWEVIY